MKLKQLILSSIALGALAFTVGVAQPAHAAIGMETPAPVQNLEKPASVTTQHHINVDGNVLEPVQDHQNVAYVDGQPLVALRQVSEALGYKVAWDAPTKTALVDMSIATLAIQPDQAQIVRKGKLQIINLDTSESILPTPRMIDGQLPSAFKLLLNDVKITKDEIFIAPQRAQLASTTNTNGPHKNEISTFLPPSDNTSAKVETSSKVESNTKSAAKDEPLIKVKHTQTTDKNTK
ncbi:MAG: stalk domain-containing protein [Veillonella sp.]|nr:stalk domain-containing protein [Veillonella sp.]